MPDDDADAYQGLLRAFGFQDLPLYKFEGPFFMRLPEWDRQTPLDRELVGLLHQRDQVSDIEKRQQFENQMRVVVRKHLGGQRS